MVRLDLIIFSICLSFLLTLLVQGASCTKRQLARYQAKYSQRFVIENQKHGSLLKVMPDGVVKVEDRHPGLLQSSSVWFYDCHAESIIDLPSNGSVNFTICHDYEKGKRKQNTPIMVFDQINEYFQIYPICTICNKKSFVNNDICSSSSCLFMPIQADIIGVDDYEDKQFYIIFKPSHNSKDRRTMKVNEIMGSNVYGRVSLIEQPRNWDVYGDHKDTLFKIHLEK